MPLIEFCKQPIAVAARHSCFIFATTQVMATFEIDRKEEVDRDYGNTKEHPRPQKIFSNHQALT